MEERNNNSIKELYKNIAKLYYEQKIALKTGDNQSLRQINEQIYKQVTEIKKIKSKINNERADDKFEKHIEREMSR